MKITIRTPRWIEPLLQPARYKGARGGRASGKSHAFAEMLVEIMVRDKNIQAVCIREIQKSLKFSAKKLIEDKIRALGVAHLFDITLTEIRRVGGQGIVIFQGMQDHTAESIKSLEGFSIAWVEEAQSISQRSLDLLVPTIRANKSELWFTWNPENEDDAVELLFQSNSKAALVHVNYLDNPWCPQEMRELAIETKLTDPVKYEHVWLGGYRVASDKPLYPFSLGSVDYSAAGLIPRAIRLRIDTPQKAEAESDYFGFTLIQDTKTGIVVVDAGHVRKSYDDALVYFDRLLDFYERHKIDTRKVIIEDANIGYAFAHSLKKIRRSKKKFEAFKLTAKYRNKFDRAHEAYMPLKTGKVLIADNCRVQSGAGVDALRVEFATFNEEDSHKNDDILDTLIWDVVEKFGECPRPKSI